MTIICKFYFQNSFDTTDFWGAAYLELDVEYSNTINIKIFGRFPESAFTKPLSILAGIF